MQGEDHVGNELSGTVHGPAVQAGVVHGGVHVHRGTGSARPVPWQLPAVAPLTDRAEELAALEDCRVRASREGRATLVAVSGLGGVGKTALVSAWLGSLRADAPDGQLFADLGAHAPPGPADPGEVVGGFLRALGVPARQVPVAFAERVALYRSLTGRRRLAVMLDDAASAAQVRPLLASGRSVVAVTSRSRLTGLVVDGAFALHLKPLSTESSLELLESTLADGRVATHPEDARSLVELCAGLPLAVRVVGARLATRPRSGLAVMLRALVEERDRLQALSIRGDHDMRATLDLSYRGLPPPVARLYRLLGLHPGPQFGTAAASAALGGDAADLLDELLDANLLIEVDEERHRFHDLVRLHAAEKAEAHEPPAERGAVLRRIADHYLAGATRAEAIIDPGHRTLPRDYGEGPVAAADVGADVASALDWLELELPTLMALVTRARPAGFPTVAWQLADAMWPLFVRRKFSGHGRTAHDEGLAAARELGDTTAECRMLTSGGLVALGGGAPEQAREMFGRAAGLFQEAGDPLGHARTLNYLGLAYRRLGELDPAAGYFIRAAAGLPEVGDRRAGGLARLNLADVCLERGLAEEAAVHAEAAHAALSDEGDTYNAARAGTLAGRAHLAQGRLEQAEARLSTALDTLRGIGADYETARAVESLADLAGRRGEHASARSRYQEALDFYRAAGRSGSPEAEAVRARLES